MTSTRKERLQLFIFVAVFFFIAEGISAQRSVKLQYGIGLDIGAISASGPDLSLTKLGLQGQALFFDDVLMISGDIGPQLFDGLELAFGTDVHIKLTKKKFITTSDLYVFIGHHWTSFDATVINTGLYYEFLDWVGLSVSYGRDYNLNSNWYSLGAFLNLASHEPDDDIIIVD